MTLQLALKITADASELKQAADESKAATRDLGTALGATGAAAAETARDLNAAAAAAGGLAAAEKGAATATAGRLPAVTAADMAAATFGRDRAEVPRSTAQDAAGARGAVVNLRPAEAQSVITGTRPVALDRPTIDLPGLTPPKFDPPKFDPPRMDLPPGAREIEAMQRAAAKLRAELDPLTAATERYNDRLAELAKLHGAGVISAEELAGGRRLAERRLAGENKGGGGLRSDQWSNLAYQGNDIVTSLAMGMSPLQVVAQQGGQVAQILSDTPGGIAGGLKTVASRTAAILTPLRLVTGGFIGLGGTMAYLGYQWAGSQKAIEDGLTGIGAMSRARVADINRIAEAAIDGNRMSRGEARGVATAIAATGRVDVSNIGAVSALAPGYAQLFGKDIEASGADLARIFADPIKGAEELNARIGGLDDRTRQYIRTMVEQGNRQEAVRAIIRTFGQDIQFATEKTSAWAAAWNWLGTKADQAGEIVARPFQAGTITEQLGEAERNLRNLRKRFVFGDADESQISDAQALVERLRLRKTAEDAAPGEKIAKDLSATVSGYVRGSMPDIAQLETLNSRVELLKKGLADPKVLAGLSVSADQARQALAQYQGAIDSFVTSDQQARRSHELTIRTIEARTAAERAAIAADRERDALAGKEIAEPERNRRIEEARQASYAQTARDAQDRLREATDRAGLAGLPSYPRQVAEWQNRRRDALKAAEGHLPTYADTQSSFAAERRGIDIEAIGGPLREANRGLAEQVAALGLQQAAFGASTDAAARMAEAQRLINEYTRAGIPITEELRRAIEQHAEAYGKVIARQEEAARRQREIVGGLDDMRYGARSGLTGLIGDLVKGKNPIDGLANSAERMALGLVDRTVSAPLVSGLLGGEGKAGGGLIGDALGGLLGKAAGVTSADITAGIVNVSGPISGIPGLGSIAAANGNVPSAASVASGLLGKAGIGSAGSDAAARGILSGLSGSRAEVAAYVQQAAAARGIDPATALRVVNQESRFDIGAKNLSAREQSYGVMQLNTMGGLGVEALKQGIDPRDPSQWRRQVDFSLDTVKRDGWRQWYGARDVGISRWEGIGRAPIAETAAEAAPKIPVPQVTTQPLDTKALDTSLRGINDAAAQAAQGTSQLTGNLAGLPGPLAQTSQGLTQVSSSLGANGGGLLGMLSQLFGGGSSAAAAPAVAAATGYVPGFAGGKTGGASGGKGIALLTPGASMSASGIVSGPGTPTSDSMLARISTGEGIIRAASVNRYGPEFIRAINDQTLPVFAAGGIAGQAPPAARPQIRERVEQASASGQAGASVNVVVKNESGVPIQERTETKYRPDGSREILMMIRREVAGEIARPGSDAGKAMEDSWGLTRNMVRR